MDAIPNGFSSHKRGKGWFPHHERWLSLLRGFSDSPIDNEVFGARVRKICVKNDFPYVGQGKVEIEYETNSGL